MSFIVQGGANLQALCGGAQLVPASGWQNDATPRASGTPAILSRYLAAGQNWWIDDVTIRRYVDAEPTVTNGPDDRV
jgi:hypothetical protein